MGMKSNIIQIREKKYIAKYYYETLDLRYIVFATFLKNPIIKKCNRPGAYA